MASQDYLLTRKLAAKEEYHRRANDKMVVMRIRDIAGGSSTPTVVLSDTQSDITITDSDGNITTADLSDGSYDTVGEVVDYLNAATGFEVRIMDALRSDASDDMWLGTTYAARTSSDGESVFDILQDSSNLASYRLRLSYDRLASITPMSKSHRITLKKFDYYADLTAAVGGIKIYKTFGNDQQTEVQIYSNASIDTTDTEIDLDNGITPGEGNELVIAVDSTVVNHASGYVQAQFNRE